MLNASDIKKLKTTQLVELYNKHSGNAPITKFADRSTAEKRVLALELDSLPSSMKAEAAAPAEAPLTKEAKKKAAKAKKISESVAKSLAKSGPREPKQGVIYHMKELVRRQQGASMEEIVKELLLKFPDKNETAITRTTRINLNPKHNIGYELIKNKEEGRGLVYTLIKK